MVAIVNFRAKVNPRAGAAGRRWRRTILSSSGRKLPVPLTVTFSRVAGGSSPEQRFCAGRPQPMECVNEYRNVGESQPPSRL
eukprot:COSAG01_NODE_4739_length_4782_cov_2.805467_2_plen_82_part_00